MKDLQKITEKCFSMLDALQIPFREDTPISYNGRITRKWGYCRKKGSGFEISIAKTLGEEDRPEEAIMSVLLHELLHTCPGCFNHGAKWKAYGKEINKAFGIKIATTSDAESLDIDMHYYIKCRRCEQKIRFAIKPKNTHGRCIVCGSKKISCFYKKDAEKVRLWKNP